MITYSLSRILQTMFVMVAISFVAFLLVANLGDPLAALLSPDATPADRAALIKALHLDEYFNDAVCRFPVGAFIG